MSGLLYVVCGGAGSGKSTLVRLALKKYKSLSLYKKYSEREERYESGIEDDIINVKKIDIGEYDLAYEAMGNKYAIRFDEINDKLNQNIDTIMPTTDFRTVERLKYFFKDRCIALCVMSTIDSDAFEKIHNKRYGGFQPSSIQKNIISESFSKLYSATQIHQWTYVYEFSQRLNSIMNECIDKRESLEIRKIKINNFQTRLFERPGIFDHLLLNYRDGQPQDMLHQFNSIYGDTKTKSKTTFNSYLFVISSASGHGKGMLAEALRIIAPNELEIIEKEAKRKSKPSDKEDGLIPIGKNGKFSSNFNFRFTSHKTKKFKGTNYAFDADRAKKSLKEGKSQILVANSLINEDLYSKLKKEFGDKVVHLFLWRFQTEAELAQYQFASCDTEEEAKARIGQTNNIYKSYIYRIGTVDNVLLNTSFPEDLHNQVFNLLSYYNLYE